MSKLDSIVDRLDLISTVIADLSMNFPPSTETRKLEENLFETQRALYEIDARLLSTNRLLAAFLIAYCKANKVKLDWGELPDSSAYWSSIEKKEAR